MSSDNTSRRKVFRPGDKLSTDTIVDDSGVVHSEIDKLEDRVPIIANASLPLLTESRDVLKAWRTMMRRRSMAGTAPLGGMAPIASTSGFDPSQLPLTGWWRDFSVVPWLGSASAGVSGANNMVSESGFGGSDPTVGTALNGHGTASFNGSTSVLQGTGTLDTYVNAKGACGWALVKTTSPGDIFGDEGGLVNFSVSVGGGATIAVLLANATDSVTRTFASGQWQLITFRYQQGGANIQIGVNEIPGSAGGTSTEGFNTALAGLTATVGLGNNINDFGAFNGLIAEFGITDQVLADSDFTDIYSYARARYPSAGLP